MEDYIKNAVKQEYKLRIMNAITNKNFLFVVALFYWGVLFFLWSKGRDWFFADSGFPILVFISLVFSVWSIWHLIGIINRHRDEGIKIARFGQIGQRKSKGEKSIEWRLRVIKADMKLISSSIAMSLIALVIIAEFIIIFPNYVEDWIAQFGRTVYDLVLAVLFLTPIIAYGLHKMMRSELHRHR